ncbi:MAG: redoxin domain-containing protein, partial [Coriobacteriales bacterium]|nr:redoxin domain-containing protein [Coriobacteriales bacterium]
MTEKPHGSKRTVLAIAVALVAVIAVAILLYQRLSPTGTPAAAPASAPRPATSTPASTQSSVQKLPQATVADSAGASVELASIGGGKPMVVNVWATWCPNCVDEMDDW